MLYRGFCGIFFLVIIMFRVEKIERKIKRSTNKKDYEKAKEIVLKEYKKQFKWMLVRHGIIPSKRWYFYHYIIRVRQEYRILISSLVDNMCEVLYSDNYDTKFQIEWLLSHCEEFNVYTLQ